MSTIYRAERDWETGSSRGPGRSYTTVKRYKIPDHSLEEDTYETEMRLVHREREPVHVQERRETREYVVEREDPSPREVREYRFVEREIERSPSPPRREVREYRIEREIERSPSPVRSVRNVRDTEYRVEREYEREYEIEPVRQAPYELERYSKSTEFYRPEAPPLPPPQPIIIRQEAPQPIILQEPVRQQIIIRREEPQYEIIERSEVAEERQVTRREPEPRREEDYYYERRVKEVDRGGRREEASFDEREYGRDRYRDRDAYSDDDAVFIRKEKDTWGGREHSPKHRRHLAEGLVGGIAAAELLRHHRKRQGENPGGRIRQTIGYGALGAVGAEAVSRLRNRSRSSSSEGRGRKGHGGSHRSRSRSRAKKIGTVAAIAGIGALAYAAGRKNKGNNTTIIEDRRSRSRRRRSSVPATIESDRHRSKSRHLDPEHRNQKAAKVGLASAAVVGLLEKHRSRSRKRKGKRSPSRIRQGIPIAAAGAAGAAVTGLYEKHKAKKEAKEISRSRSRSRGSRSRSVPSGSRRRSTASDGALVEYGGDPIYTDRVSSSRDRRHRRRTSSSSSDDRRKHRSSRSRSRSKSRARKAAETAAVAGVAGLAAHEAAKRRDRKKAEKEQRRHEDAAYSNGSYSPTQTDATESRYFPDTNYFPPPPTAPIDPNYPPYNQYNPADYPPQQNINTASQAGYPHSEYGPPPVQEPGNMYAQDHRRHPDDNVSATSNPKHINRDGIIEPEPIASPKSVQFNPYLQEREISPNRKPDNSEDEEGERDERGRHHRGDNDHHHHHHRDGSPDSVSSDSTIELPPRFDELGRQRDLDPLAKSLESVLVGLFSR